MPRPERLGRLLFAIALIGFGAEGIAFGHYVVARAAPWPADPQAQHLVADVTGALFVACGGAILAGRWVREAALQAAFLILAWFVKTLVPPFIPGAEFWTYFAAAALLAAGFGLLAPPVRRLAAVCAGWMVLSWVFLVHVPLIFRLGALEWQGVFEALGISGVCLLLADSTLRAVPPPATAPTHR